MTHKKFWQIVEELDWPNVHYDKASRHFMEKYNADEADEFHDIFLRLKGELRKSAAVTEISDSMDDALAHTIGLGQAEYERCIADPAQFTARRDSGDFRESFAYCIPFPEDYGYLTDEGYEKFRGYARELIDEIDATDPDDIPPKQYRRFPEVREVCELLESKDWQRAVFRYHELFGPGYADDWPIHSYAIPNFVKTLENYRLS